jgi:hypothetical protein
MFLYTTLTKGDFCIDLSMRKSLDLRRNKNLIFSDSIVGLKSLVLYHVFIPFTSLEGDLKWIGCL